MLNYFYPKISVSINWMWSVLLLGANFFSIDEISLIITLNMLALNGFVLWQNALNTRRILGSLIFLETHCHWRSLTANSWRSNSTYYTNSVVIVRHFKYFLLLSSQTVLVWIWFIFSSIHIGKSHCSRYKNIVILSWVIIRSIYLTWIWRCNSLLVNIVIVVLL